MLTSDLKTSFTNWDPRNETESSSANTSNQSWTAEHGFDDAAPQASSKMRLVGQRGSFDGAIHPEATRIDESEPSELEEEPTRDLSPRYVPIVGRRETFDRPPTDLVETVRQATGVNVGDAQINRSPQATERATEIGAIAYTESGMVHLPAELGPLDNPQNRAIVAHELTHVAQRRIGDGDIPSEDSREGRVLEHQAREVQRAVAHGTPVRPHYLRNSPRVTSGPAGIQRLAGNADEYDWQDRADAPGPSTGSSVMGAIFGGFGRLDEETRQRQQDSRTEQWARQHETDNAQQLQGLRNAQYATMVDQARREIRVRQRRGDLPEGHSGDLNRDDIIGLRERLDAEMPYEFGVPEGLDAYPGELPPASESDSEPESSRSDGPSDALSSQTRRNPERHTRRTPPSARTVGQTSGANGPRRAPLRHQTRGQSEEDENNFDWQERDSTGNEVLTSIFGGLIGGLFGLAGKSDEEQRREAEKEDLPDLLDKRKEKERTLRHRRLRQKQLEGLREEKPFPVGLEDSDITEIRVTVDSEMPLEFEIPDYLDSDEDVRIDIEGNVLDAGPATAQDGDEAAQEEAEETAANDDTGIGTDGENENADVDPAAPVVDAAASTRSGGDASTQLGLATQSDAAQSDAAPPNLTQPDATQPDTNLIDESSDAGDDREESDSGQTQAGRVFATATDLDFDFLTRRLYGRIRSDLRHELLIDRERAGVLADAR